MKKGVLLLTLMVVFLLAIGGSALAASSPQDIYNDYLQNGKLTGDYSDGELQAYLGDAGVRQYGDTTVLGALDEIVKALLAGTSEPGRDKFPFTGAEILLMVLGGVALVGAGAAVRLTAKRGA
jgi:hypothetical protein